LAAAAAIGLKKSLGGREAQFLGEAMPVYVGSGESNLIAKKRGPQERSEAREHREENAIPLPRDPEAISNWQHDPSAVHPRRL
jgi:hypothetical protein